jgi:hypothetical protein
MGESWRIGAGVIVDCAVLGWAILAISISFSSIGINMLEYHT